MRNTCPLALVALALFAPFSWGQGNVPAPHLGYLYPAGGERGATFRVFAGGQTLRGVKSAHVSGAGVRVTVVSDLGRLQGLVQGLDRDQKLELARRFVAARGGDPSQIPAPEGDAELPDHPILKILEDLGPQELDFLAGTVRPDPKAQLNPQISEAVLLEVTIEAGAAPGDRELRLVTELGLTNPMRFQVGELPEVRETEAVQLVGQRNAEIAEPEPVDLPVLFNGRIKPGDADRFLFRAREGQKLVLAVAARHLVPFLADAVPGWFQATIALFDESGRELAFADDFRLDPDPVLFYEVKRTGVYRLEIRDAIYRGRDDFVYRIRAGELPFITSLFPLGGPTGSETVATVEGVNLGTTELALDTSPGGQAIRETALAQGGLSTNRVAYAVGADPEFFEVEPNDSPEAALWIETPAVINGRIALPGDRDFFRFEGEAGDEIAIEVVARRLGSRLDSLIRVSDSSGRVLAWNDDSAEKDGFLHLDVGSVTHQADSKVALSLPSDGTYVVELGDAAGQGGRDSAYRLHIGPPAPDFELSVTPSSLALRAGLSAVLEVRVLRRGGFDGPVDLRLAGAPAGFELAGARIPAGRDHVRITLAAPRDPPQELVTLKIEGTATLGGRRTVRPAVPAEDAMQAFLYRHLLPSMELVVSAGGKFRFPPLAPESDLPVSVAPGRTVPVKIRVPRQIERQSFHFVLRDPPEGLALERWTVDSGVLTLFLAASAEAKPIGGADNLIVEVYLERGGEGAEGGQPKKRILVGVLPAIPCEVVKP